MGHSSPVESDKNRPRKSGTPELHRAMLFWGVLWTVGVTCAAVSLGICLANRHQERRYVRQTGQNLARIMVELHLPATASLVDKLKQISDCEIVLVEGSAVLATTLPAEELAQLAGNWQTPEERRPTGHSERYLVQMQALADTGLQLWLFLPRRNWPSSLRDSSAGIIVAGLAGGLLAFLVWWLIASSYQRLWQRLQAANSRLELAERLALAGKMSAAVTHELRNPLSGIKMNAQVLQEEFSAAGRPDESVQFIVKEIDRIEAYLQELSGRSFGATGVDEITQPLPELLRDLDKLLQERFRHAGVQLQCHCQLTEPENLPGFPRILRETLLNLLGNALEASVAGHRVELNVAACGADIVFTVSDQGEGIKCPPGTDIFAPFVSSKKRGCGLGLYFAANAAAQMGGKLSWHNETTGAVFVLTLPKPG